MTDTLVKVDNVSKKFCRSLKRSLWYGMQDLGSELVGRRHGGNGELRPDEFWAVQDVSFELKRGECLGLIGRNGAGKTTLLRMLNGLIKPDSGRIEMRGRIGALIALGAGFNPILTGRENIYVNAAVLGLSKQEIDERLEDIVEFAELGAFIDTPVQNYSSGMTVRLGFSVTTALRPDILILDEVLAVGDSDFQLKCLNRLGSLLESGTAALMVTHQLNNLERHARRGVVLETGRVAYTGSIEQAIDHYNQSSTSGLQSAKIIYPEDSVIRIVDIFGSDPGATKSPEVKIAYEMTGGFTDACHASFTIRSNGIEILRSTTKKDGLPPVTLRPSGTVSISIPEAVLRLPNLRLSVSLWDVHFRRNLLWIRDLRLESTSPAPSVSFIFD